MLPSTLDSGVFTFSLIRGVYTFGVIGEIGGIAGNYLDHIMETGFEGLALFLILLAAFYSLPVLSRPWFLVYSVVFMVHRVKCGRVR